jgi:hypothetical protein
MMLMEILHIAYFPPWSGWLLQIMTRLSGSPSATLKSRMEAWGSTPLSEMGSALASKMSMLGRVLRRFDQQMRHLTDELKDQSDATLREMVREKVAHTTADEALPYEILVEVDSFFFESRSAYEILGQFLRGFFKRILAEDVSESEIIKLLEEEQIDSRWIKQLRDHCVLFFHNTAPWIALEVVSWEPRRFELLVLKMLVPNDTRDMIRFKELVEIYRGFAASMAALHRFVLKKIEEFEARDAREVIA